MNPETTPLPPDETHELPFEFSNAYWENTNSGRFLCATWRNQLCWTTRLDDKWHFDKDDVQIDISHFDIIYPHSSQVDITRSEEHTSELQSP